MDIGLRAPFVRKGPFACWALFASKSLGGQPRAYILFPSQIYPAKDFIGLDLVQFCPSSQPPNRWSDGTAGYRAIVFPRTVQSVLTRASIVSRRTPSAPE